MKRISSFLGAINPDDDGNRFDGSQVNDHKTTRLLAALASVASEHTTDKLARQMIRAATAELFNAAARLERLNACGRQRSGAEAA